MIGIKLREFFLLNIRKTASQFGQDIWVAKSVFKSQRKKFFIELGAFEGIVLSNTLLLEKKFDWSGILIEANHKCFENLKRNRQSKNSVCVNACISSKRKLANFVLNDELGGILNEDLESQSANEIVEIATVPLEKVLLDNNAPKVIDYLSLDVEGFEDEVLLDFPFESYRFLSMTIERPSLQLKEKLKNEGYILVKEVPYLDSYFIHESIAETYRDNLILETWNYFLFKINAILNYFGC
jgi:FkbM family methyltransferase